MLFRSATEILPEDTSAVDRHYAQAVAGHAIGQLNTMLNGYVKHRVAGIVGRLDATLDGLEAAALNVGVQSGGQALGKSAGNEEGDRPPDKASSKEESGQRSPD